jgi:hypothetical protein
MELFDFLLEAYGDAEKFAKNAVKEDAVKNNLCADFYISVNTALIYYYSVLL